MGLDAAKTRIDAMKGMITVDSFSGSGTRFSVYVPLTLAISRGVLIEEGDIPAIVPMSTVVEILALTPDHLREMKEDGAITHRGSQVTALALSEMLYLNDRAGARSAVLLGVGEKRRALVARRVVGETDMVCRPLPEAMVAPGFIAGAAELHDGRPALIIQPEDLLREHPTGGAGGSSLAYRLPDSDAEKAWRDGKVAHLLIFSNESAVYGIALEMLREVITLRSVTAVPILGEAWEGIFFHRGVCHGLLRLSGGRSSKGHVSTVAILDSPGRCGIGMSQIYGNCTIPISDIVTTVEDTNLGLLRPCGVLKWRDRNVTILAVRTKRLEGQCSLMAAADGKH